MLIKLVNLTPITTRSNSLVNAGFRPCGGDGEGGFKKSAATRVKGPRHSKRDLKWRKRERRGLSPSEKEQKDTIRIGKRFGGGWKNLAIWPLCL